MYETISFYFLIAKACLLGIFQNMLLEKFTIHLANYKFVSHMVTQLWSHFQTKNKIISKCEFGFSDVSSKSFTGSIRLTLWCFKCVFLKGFVIHLYKNNEICYQKSSTRVWDPSWAKFEIKKNKKILKLKCCSRFSWDFASKEKSLSLK
mgnify:CR=1 FL=1